MMWTYQSSRIPNHVKPGSVWLNTKNGYFYVLDEHERWVASDSDGLIVDIINVGQGEAEEAYDRAMGIL